MKKTERIKVYEKYDGHCAYCGKELVYKDMQVDHLEPRLNGLISAEYVEKFENYMPSCRRCNHYKRAHSLKEFRQLLVTLHERLMKQYLDKVAFDYNIIKIKPFGGLFYFEKED